MNRQNTGDLGAVKLFYTVMVDPHCSLLNCKSTLRGILLSEYMVPEDNLESVSGYNLKFFEIAFIDYLLYIKHYAKYFTSISSVSSS